MIYNFADYSGRQDPNAPSNLIAMSGEPHANRRRIWNRGMSSDSLKHYEDIIRARAEEWIKKFEIAYEPVDLVAWIGYFTYVPVHVY